MLRQRARLVSRPLPPPRGRTAPGGRGAAPRDERAGPAGITRGRAVIANEANAASAV